MEKIKRLFIDSDVLQDDELSAAKRAVWIIKKREGVDLPEDVFDETCDFAWHEGRSAWEAVKRCDEIYANSSFTPLCGYGSYTGAPVVMDRMMQAAIAENITGKSLILLRPSEDIDWEQIDLSLIKSAFEHNRLFTLEYDKKGNRSFVPVNIDSIISEHSED